MGNTKDNAPAGRVQVSEAKRYVIDCITAAKADPSHASQMADLLIEADYRGHFSHGLNRLDQYVKDLQIGTVDGFAKPEIIQQTVATAWVDGHNALGVVCGNFAMHLAIEKAKNVGIGLVTVKNGNHFGMSGWYSTLALKEGLIGISMTNTSKVMSPTRSKGSALGTNPISFAAPASGDDRFVLDMATTTVAIGKLEMKLRKNEPSHPGWAQDENGHPTSDSQVAFDTACLTPLGGPEETSGYKGYGLGVMVEMLSVILSGALFSHEGENWYTRTDSPGDIGQCFLAIDPKCFSPNFYDRSSELLNHLRQMPRTNPELPVIVAGDRSKAHKKNVDENGGIPYIPNQIETCEKLAKQLGVKPMIVQ